MAASVADWWSRNISAGWYDQVNTQTSAYIYMIEDVVADGSPVLALMNASYS